MYGLDTLGVAMTVATAWTTLDLAMTVWATLEVAITVATAWVTQLLVTVMKAVTHLVIAVRILLTYVQLQVLRGSCMSEHVRYVA